MFTLIWAPPPGAMLHGSEPRGVPPRGFTFSSESSAYTSVRLRLSRRIEAVGMSALLSVSSFATRHGGPPALCRHGASGFPQERERLGAAPASNRAERRPVKILRLTRRRPFRFRLVCSPCHPLNSRVLRRLLTSVTTPTHENGKSSRLRTLRGGTKRPLRVATRMVVAAPGRPRGLLLPNPTPMEGLRSAGR